MKLLIDNNLSVLLKEVLEEPFPGSIHVFDLNLSDASDNTLWNLAKEEYDAIITKDRDFYYQVLVHGSPPKIIWITRGNCKNREMLSLIRSKVEDIEIFLNSDQDILIIQ